MTTEIINDNRQPRNIKWICGQCGTAWTTADDCKREAMLRLKCNPEDAALHDLNDVQKMNVPDEVRRFDAAVDKFLRGIRDASDSKAAARKALYVMGLITKAGRLTRRFRND